MDIETRPIAFMLQWPEGPIGPALVWATDIWPQFTECPADFGRMTEAAHRDGDDVWFNVANGWAHYRVKDRIVHGGQETLVLELGPSTLFMEEVSDAE